MSPEDFILKEIVDKLSSHKNGSSLDFSILQILIWSSILASAASAFLAAVSSPKKWITAILAVVPALAITAESNFSFSGRYKYHDEYIVELESLQRQLIVEEVDAKLVSNGLTTLQRDMEAKFPSATVIGRDRQSRCPQRGPHQIHSNISPARPNPAFEPTHSGKPGLASISFWLKPGLPSRAAQRKR